LGITGLSSILFLELQDGKRHIPDKNIILSSEVFRIFSNKKKGF